VTSRASVLDQIGRTEPGSYVARGGAGLGWAGGASVGIKLAQPDSRVVSLVGDGSYLFSNPVAHAWLAAEYDAPTLTVVYNNARWNAVRSATAAQHPDGDAVADGVPESEFGTPLDLSVPARAAGLHTQRVEDETGLADALAEAVDVVDSGTPAVVDVQIQ
jgi:acetolactate synthase-1/2/3 large subunit